MKKLAPSILSADFANLEREVKLIEDGGAHLIHIDVMDGHFVPNISYGATVMKSLLGKCHIPFDVHLMIEEPDKYIKDFITDNTEYITVHQEACPHLHRTLSHIKEYGAKAGVSINPATPIESIVEVIDQVDMVLIMSVNPGFGGQKFIESTLRKAMELDKIRKKRGLCFKMEMDGGIDLRNAKAVVDAGIDIVVSGSGVYKALDVTKATTLMIEEINK